jgi:catechol-2,3-dioxygenase
MTTNNQQQPNTPSVSMEGMTLHVENVEHSLEFYTKIPGVQVLTHRR